MAVASIPSSFIYIWLNIMEWFPIVAGAFKVIALGTGMFFAVKWHYDQGKKGKQVDRRALLRASALWGVVFMLLLAGLGVVTYIVATRLGLDLNLP